MRPARSGTPDNVYALAPAAFSPCVRFVCIPGWPIARRDLRPKASSIDETQFEKHGRCQRPHPRHDDVGDRAEEKEHNDLGKVALHDNILRRWLSSPAAFGTAGKEFAAEVVLASRAITVVGTGHFGPQ